MDPQQPGLRFGAALIVCALIFRLFTGGWIQSASEILSQPNISSLLIYLETGRHVRFSPSSGYQGVFSPESAAPDFGKQRPRFTAADADAVSVRYNCTHRPDLGALISQPLEWDLTKGGPAVLILHTHATESYTRSAGENYAETSAFRTLDENYNMLSVGDRVAQLLEEGGITVIHDRTLHDYPSYNGSYGQARKTIQAHMAACPSIRLVLDLHRDASGDNHNQMTTHTTVNGRDSARMMLVVGTGAASAWEENLALGLKLHVQAERIAPGIMRYVNLRSQRFNQDLLPGTLLVEMGAAGDSHDQALAAAEVLAESILALARGCEIDTE